ncbi:MAG: helix-turn-helix domain-containing protein [Hyphomicrobium sp.]
MRPIAHPALSEITLPYVLYALSDPIRLEIVRRLREADNALSCADATGTVLPKSTMSFHFKALREAGLIRTRQEGRTKYNEIHPGFDKRFPGLLKTILAQVRD